MEISDKTIKRAIFGLLCVAGIAVVSSTGTYKLFRDFKAGPVSEAPLNASLLETSNFLKHCAHRYEQRLVNKKVLFAKALYKHAEERARIYADLKIKESLIANAYDYPSQEIIGPFQIRDLRAKYMSHAHENFHLVLANAISKNTVLDTRVEKDLSPPHTNQLLARHNETSALANTIFDSATDLATLSEYEILDKGRRKSKAIEKIKAVSDIHIDYITRELGLDFKPDQYALDHYRICEDFFGAYQSVVGEKLIFLRQEIEEREKQFQNMYKYYSDLFRVTVNAFFVTTIAIIIIATWNLLFLDKFYLKYMLLAIPLTVVFATSFGYTTQYASAYSAYINMKSLRKMIDYNAIGLVEDYERCLKTVKTFNLKPKLTPLLCINIVDRKQLEQEVGAAYVGIEKDHATHGSNILSLPSIDLPQIQ